MKNLKASIIGCGRMGMNHLQVLNELSINLLSVADPIENNCKSLISKAAKNGEKTNYYSNIDQLLSHKLPDIVIIATTADNHIENAIKSVVKGVKYILIEKPLGTSLASCLNLINSCCKNGSEVAVNHQMRFMTQYCEPKKILASDKYAGFKSMNVTSGNFGLAMNGTHYFEAFRFLVEEKPLKVSAWFDESALPNPRGPQFQDVSGCIRVTTASGKRLHIDASADQGHGVQVTYMARNGRITIDELTGTMTTVVRQPEHREAPTSRYGMPVDIEEHKIKPVELVDSTKAVLEALVKGENYPTLHDGTLAVKTLIAAYHSHRKGGIPIKIADIPDNDREVFPWA